MKSSRLFSYWVDRWAARLIAIGGLSVIGAILLIAIYLVAEVVPMFRPASVEPGSEFALPGPEQGRSLYLAVEEQVEVGMRVATSGEVVFFATADGRELRRESLPTAGAGIVSLAVNSEESHLFAVSTDDGRVVLARHNYKPTYGDGGRQIVPELEYPFGTVGLELLPGQPLPVIALRDTGDELTLVGATGSGMLVGARFTRREDFLTGETILERERLDFPELGGLKQLLVAPDQRHIFALDDHGRLRILGASGGKFSLEDVITAEHGRILGMQFLLGGLSLMTYDDQGGVTQWFFVREGNDLVLSPVRRFEGEGAPVTRMLVEQRRKGFAAIDAGGQLAIYHSTAHRRLAVQELGRPGTALVAAGLAPRANYLLAEFDDGRVAGWRIHNEHPEVSWSALWSRVWYESYPEPQFIWQSSAANNDFEPKYSLTPLVFGTLKAAFYSMLLAAPLAICAAIYTAYFMAPALRRKVKPLVELMGALPTVILGFLAGLWLAPFMENHLVGVFAMILLLPVAVLLAAFAWSRAPARLVQWVPDGWTPILLLPVVLLAGWLAVKFSGWLEVLLFDGNLTHWITQELGIPYDQRNALVVGVAMGFAVIPSIYSIAEDAIFSVPRHLSNGSLALGATPWQTLVGVVLPTASPGIFSALMIGFGRAVGETMIVLMATGNTPIMDLNIFEGMRTLAANLAVEVAETEVGSTHYRVLFLAALVLFLFTFLVNTAAEVIRQRLRDRYGNI